MESLHKHNVVNSPIISKLIEHSLNLEAELMAANELLVLATNKPLKGIQAGRTVEEVKNELLITTLDACRGDKDKAARMMGVSLKTLYNWYNALKIR